MPVRLLFSSVLRYSFRCRPSTVRRPPSAVSRLLSIVRRSPSTVDRKPSAVSRPPSAVCRLPSTVLLICMVVLSMGNKNGRASSQNKGNTGAPGDETSLGQPKT